MISSSNVPIVVSARMRSTRCPGKALAPLAGKPLLEHLLLRLSSVFGTDRVILATSRSKDNDLLSELAGRLEIGT